jgi:multiple sugar transport system substrate-binding protein
MTTRHLQHVMLSLPLLALAACADPEPRAVEGSRAKLTSENITLNIAWWGSQNRDDRTNAVIGMFHTLHPNISFIAKSYRNTQGTGNPVTDYWPAMNKNAADGTLPDIMQHDYAYIEEWSTPPRSLLLPLDDLVTHGDLDLSDVPPGLVDGGRVAGKLMGVSLGLNTQTVVIDLDVFAAAGIPIPSDSWTWQDFKQIAMKIREKLGKWGAGSSFHGYTPGWKAVTLSMGQWVFSADGKALGYTDDRPWTHHWQILRSLVEADAEPTLDQEPKGSNVEALLMVGGKTAMEHLHSNQLVAMWTAAEKGGVTRNLKLLPLPRIQGGISPVYMKPSQYFSITRNSAHPVEAAAFIDFFTNSIDANLILGGERGVPVATKVLAALKPQLTRQAAESFNLIERATSYATTLPPNDPPAWTTILTTIFTPKVELPIMAGQITPKAGVELFRSEASAVLAGP